MASLQDAQGRRYLFGDVRFVLRGGFAVADLWSYHSLAFLDGGQWANVFFRTVHLGDEAAVEGRCMTAHITALLKAAATMSPQRATAFFKTGPGDYAQHDKFMGVPVPCLRKVAKQFKELSLDWLDALLGSAFNEERLLALLILVQHYQAADLAGKAAYYRFYLDHLAGVNNWNLVDASAHRIVGAHLRNQDKAPLFTLAQSANLWERRIAIVATWADIRAGELDITFSISELLLKDPHDLIHKATGWMLREAGKRNPLQLIAFLEAHAGSMPRVMLRYALERLPQDTRKRYLGRPH